MDDPAFDRHEPPGDHPERPERLGAARRAVRDAAGGALGLPARPATDDELARVHAPAYVESLPLLAGRRGYLDPDTYYGPGSAEAARRAAGGACALVEALVAGKALAGAALLRPPGHHARPDAAMGFCLLNNAAVAAAHARALGVPRVAIVDWDVHHGNGTQEAFWEDPSVLYVSLHQYPFYPGSGAATEVGGGDGTGFTVNVPLSAGAGPTEYAAAFDRVVVPVLASFAPRLVIVSAGFDAHRRDPLAQMALDAPSYAAMAASVRSAAGGDVPVAAVLEGGYDLRALEESLGATIGALVGKRAAPAAAAAVPPSARHEADLARAVAAQRPFWRL